LKDVVEAISVPAVLVDREARIGAANAAARKIFGDRIAGRHFVTALRQPPLLEGIEAALVSGTAGRAKYLASDARADVIYDARITPVSDTGSVLVCFEDRTAMQEAGQMRRDFVANVSHELRSPLTAVLGFIETLRGAAKDDPVAQDRFLTIMEDEANRMNRLVHDLLSLSRVEAEGRVRPSEPVDLPGVVHSVIGTLAALAKEQGTGIMTQGLDVETLVPGDADQLGQVVRNLLENAIKYAGKDQDVTIRMTRDAAHPLVRGAAVILSIEDKGEGIDARHIPRLTERFYRIDSHRSRELGGTGLGLAIVKHIVNRHRGRLQIESTLGKGSCFSVILPMDA
jgi:two-component system phosphate regulon sensor histidine kinase PhoR